MGEREGARIIAPSQENNGVRRACSPHVSFWTNLKPPTAFAGNRATLGGNGIPLRYTFGKMRIMLGRYRNSFTRKIRTGAKLPMRYQIEFATTWALGAVLAALAGGVAAGPSPQGQSDHAVAGAVRTAQAQTHSDPAAARLAE